LSRRPLRRAIDGREHVALAEQHAAARHAVTENLPGDQPSINGPDIDAA
jgi:hypothetical protein